MMRNNNAVHPCDFRMHDIIDKKYRVERVISTSPAHQRFKVIDPEGKEYILKLFKLWEAEPRLRRDMLTSADNEIKSCQIKSNYLTNIVKTGTVNGNPYLLTEYSNSTALSHHIKNPKLDTIKTAKEILYGLRDLHKSGKVHSRLTPENILVADDNHIMITNYVILGDRGRIFTNQNKTLHTRFVDKSLAYQAPELYRPERYPATLPAIDIFAFGTILFQLLTGELPYGRLATESDWMHYQSRVNNDDWNRNSLLRNEQREMWTSILEICLSADTSKRAANIDEIIEKFPPDNHPYISIPGSQVEAPRSILNGIMLHIMQGEQFGTYYRLPEIIQPPKRIITVGRTDNTIFNMIQLSEHTSAYISRRHCTIELDDETDTWYIRDGQWDKQNKDKWTRSLNGTYLNSEEVSQEGHKIKPGDIITIGNIKLRVEGY